VTDVDPSDVVSASSPAHSAGNWPKADDAGPDAEPGLLRSSAPITAWNLVSRLTGFVRVLAVGAALGTTFLGNTYQSANLASNILFELLAAGVLSSVLVPAFVAHIRTAGRDDADRLAGNVLGMLLAILGPIVVAGMLAGPWIMRGLTITVDDAAVRHAEVDLGAFFLWFFLPQVLLYAVGTVATALNHAENRFVAPASAPVANNIVVTAAMAGYWVVRNGAPSLHLPLSQKLLLALGTTVGVAAMTAVPVVALWRRGLSLRPRWAPRDPELRSMGRQGAWAAGYLGLTQVLLSVTLVLANRVEGGAVAYQIAFTFFLLPYALVGNPIMTALFPRLAADAHAGERIRYADRLSEGLRLLAFFVLPASAILVATARPVLDVLAFGALARGGPLVARTLAAYAVGLIGYAAFQLLTRAFYADGDTRTPTLVNLVVVGLGSVLMVAWWAAADGGDKVVVLGLTHSLVQLAAAGALLVLLARRLPERLHLTRPLVRTAAASAAAGGAAWAATHAISGHTRSHALASLVLAAVCGAMVYAAAQWGAWPTRKTA
jgi:putative peptidoglycan lipid II flippase